MNCQHILVLLLQIKVYNLVCMALTYPFFPLTERYSEWLHYQLGQANENCVCVHVWNTWLEVI